MKIIIGCEYSQLVTKAFRKYGHEAYSCDLLLGEINSTWHIQTDILTILNDNWDMGIFFPPCTHLCMSGARWFKSKKLDNRQKEGINFFMEFTKVKIKRVCIENPIGIMSSVYRKPDQIIQPWMFGHGETKATCLWLKNLPKLVPTNIVDGRENRIHQMPPSINRGKERSRTYTGIAEAMAEQWGNEDILNYKKGFFDE